MAATGIMRLNRRRYKESVSALKQLIADQKTPAARRLSAIQTLLGIYDRHDRSELQRNARKLAADAPPASAQPTAAAEATETLEGYLARARAEREREEMSTND